MTEPNGVSESNSGVRSATGGPGGPGGRRRPPPELVEVVDVARSASRMVTVSVKGDDLSRFAEAAPTSHVKVFLPAGGSPLKLPTPGPEGLTWPDGPRPTVRTYTPRAYDKATGVLQLQFVLHGEGPASNWAVQAKIGDVVGVAGPGGRFVLDESATHWWIAGDESALPAIGTLLDVLAPSVTADVHLLVDSAADECELPSAATLAVHWHHRRSSDSGTVLEEAARAADFVPGSQAWVAAEAADVRRVRAVLLGERNLPREAVTTRGYWRAGVQNHPDHDYGED
jgi:NADPH-dependent ferric siderophore reductase